MILKIQMINCQSWKNSSFSLATDKVNVIVADNGTGKSVLFKMLKITSHPKYFDRNDRKDLIRHGAECAEIYFAFDDGGIAATKVYPTYVLYLYKPDDNSEVEASYEPNPEMLQRVGLISDGDTPFVANIVDSDQDLLLVNTRLKYNFNLVKMLVENVDLESVKERVSEAQYKISNPISSINSRCAVLQKAISNSVYCDVATRELQLDLTEQAENVMFALIDVVNDLLIIKDVMSNKTDYDFLLKAEELMESLESCSVDDLFPGKDYSYLEPVLRLTESIESFDLDGLRIAKPVDSAVEDTLQLLEQLEQLEFSDVFVGSGIPDLEDEVKLLESLEELPLADLRMTVKPAIQNEHIDLLERSEQIYQIFVLLSSIFMTMHDAKQKADEAESNLLKAGTVYDCSIYGKVVYDGKSCLPYSE